MGNTALKAPVRAKAGALSAGIRTVLLAVLLALMVRTFVFELFSIPSESMMPQLLTGDYVIVQKYPYGFGRASFPWRRAPIGKRIGGQLPLRGDIVVFADPNGRGISIIKRVAGLPGDEVELRGGEVFINGTAAVRKRIANASFPMAANMRCQGGRVAEIAGRTECIVPRYREELPSGGAYTITDTPRRGLADDMPARRVPAGYLFVLGDNRDNSEDSRYTGEMGGFGLVPIPNLIGRAHMIFLSVDGSAEMAKPWTWPGAVRFDRIGIRL